MFSSKSKTSTSPCSVDTVLGVRSKMILLSGYVWEDGVLCYRVEALKAFGIMSAKEEDGTQLLALHKLYWLANPRQDMIIIGEVHDLRVQPCIERPCSSVVSMFGKALVSRTGASDAAAVLNKQAFAREVPAKSIPNRKRL